METLILFIWKFVVFAFVLGLLVFVHELGHFLFAKLCGVGVVKFAIGFGRPIVQKRWGETFYQIGWIPLGGYVRMIGDMPDIITGPQESDSAVRDGEVPPLPPEERTAEYQAMLADRSRWFIERPLLQRTAIVFAGPLFNFVLAILLVASNVYLFGEAVPVDLARIGGVVKESPADLGGLKTDDTILAVNGKSIASWKELATEISGSGGEPVNLKVESAGAIRDLSITPKKKSIPMGSEVKTVYQIGIEAPFRREAVGGGRSLIVGYLWSEQYVVLTYRQLWGMLTGKVSPKELAGPLFIFNAGPSQAEKGVETFITFIALLSVSLAALNLLPIPVLDGGHLLFFFIEAVVGPISIRKKEIAQQFGVIVLLVLMVCALGNDISRSWQSFRSKSAGTEVTSP